jgi:AraC-like DNA-binding protein
MRLLRQARLAQARSELAAPRPGTTVTRVALDCGFTHLGRFSQEYVRRFGERPSETLQRARGRQSTSAREMAIAS